MKNPIVAISVFILGVVCFILAVGTANGCFKTTITPVRVGVTTVEHPIIHKRVTHDLGDMIISSNPGCARVRITHIEKPSKGEIASSKAMMYNPIERPSKFGGEIASSKAMMYNPMREHAVRVPGQRAIPQPKGDFFRKREAQSFVFEHKSYGGKVR